MKVDTCNVTGGEAYPMFAAQMYRQLTFDRPSVAATFGTEFTLYISDDSDPSHVYAPKSYVDLVAPAIKKAFSFEMNYSSYDALTAEQKADYDAAWQSVFDILPDYVQTDIPTYKQGMWDIIEVDELVTNIQNAAQREEILRKHYS